MTLGAIYMSSELYMLTDYSEDFVDTRDFLRRHVTDAEAAGSPAAFAMKHVSQKKVWKKKVYHRNSTSPTRRLLARPLPLL
jgi:ubiquinone biosynthesis protein COQ9